MQESVNHAIRLNHAIGLILRRAVLDRVLDLGRHAQLHREREHLAVVGHEGCGRPRRALALEVDPVAARLRELAEEAHRLGREAAPHLGDQHEHLVAVVNSLSLSLSLARSLSLSRLLFLSLSCATLSIAQHRAARAGVLG